MYYFFIMELGIGILLAGTAIPLILEKIGPNPVYGFKTKKTFSSKEIWFKVNKYLGKVLLVTGIIIIIFGAIFLIIGKDFDEVLTTILFCSTGFIPIIISVVLPFLYLRKL